MRVGVYVGSFDPVHIGHKSIIKYVSSVLDKLIVIPTNNYWDKITNATLSDRIAMLKYYESDKVEISTTLNDYEYTYQILNELNKKYDDLYLIIGADNLKSFYLWKNVDEILERYKVYVLGRDEIDMNMYISKFENKDKFILDNKFKEINISSSEIRNSINESSKLEKYLDKEVLNYINKNNLYKSHN